MATRGKIYIVPNAAEQRWDLVVKNEGDTVLGVTNNILKPEHLEQSTHDDEGRFGHGLLVSPGGVSHQSFPKGESYNHSGTGGEHPIEEDCFIRVGLRDLAERAVKLPPLDGKPIVIDVETGMRWYAGDPATARINTEYMDSYARDAKHTLHMDVADGDAILDQIARLMGAKEQGRKKKIDPRGHVIIKAVEAKGGGVAHWDVRFTNTGTTPFMGTIVLVGATKNAGRGLESMPVPKKGSAAEQRILAGEDYGLCPEPGSVVRLGIRGHSSLELKLPRRGRKRINLKDFDLGQTGTQADFFDAKSLKEKQREKIGRVKFFEGGKVFHPQEAVFTGQEARARATYNPPKLSIENVRGHVYDAALHDAREVRSGWQIRLEGTMPYADDRGRLGFVPRFFIDGEPADALFHPHAILGEDEMSWILDRGATVNGVEVRDGAILEIDTGGLGWSTRIPLIGRRAQAKTDFGEWELREHKAHRWDLERELSEG